MNVFNSPQKKTKRGVSLLVPIDLNRIWYTPLYILFITDLSVFYNKIYIG